MKYYEDKNKKEYLKPSFTILIILDHFVPFLIQFCSMEYGSIYRWNK